jgi:hypothetical protein
MQADTPSLEPQVPEQLLPPSHKAVKASSIYGAIVYVLGGYGQSVISEVFFLSYPVSCVNLSMLPLTLSLSLFLSSLRGPEP